MNSPPAGFEIRRASVADLAPFGDISRRTFIDTYAASHTVETLARHVAERFDDEVLLNELTDSARTVLVLTRDGTLAGYAMLRQGTAPPAVTGTRPVEVERFYVDRPWHGQGLGAPLMAALLSAAREQRCDTAWLGVWQQNPRAVRFYEKRGFRVVGHQVYLFDGREEDDHLMAVSL